MQTATEKVDFQASLTLPIKRKISGKDSEASRRRESSRRAKERNNSRYGRNSQQSYLTFAPKAIQPKPEEYNLKLNPVDDE